MKRGSNIYQTVVVLSKRARQISARQKADLDEKLAYYEGFTPEVENVRMQEDQARVSIEHEQQPKPTEAGPSRKLLAEEVYFRTPNESAED